MEASDAHVPVANRRTKFLYLSTIVMLTTCIASLTTTGILIYDKIQQQNQPTEEGLRAGGQSLPNGAKGSVTTGSLPNGANGTVTTGIPTTRSPIPTTLSAPLTSGVTDSTQIHTLIVLSTENTTIDDTSPCQPSLSNITTDYLPDCSGFNIAVGQIVIHRFYPHDSENTSALVNCVSTCDGLWTVIRKRFGGSVDFYRGWTDYTKGFGDASGEYWLGNDAIHQLTSRSSYRLKVVLKNTDNVTAYAIYDTFQISDESDGYRLTIGGYHGDAGDSLSQHDGQMFSTLDRDNDSHTMLACAERHAGSWWFYNCLYSDLNGPYLGSNSWTPFSSELPLKETTMMIQMI